MKLQMRLLKWTSMTSIGVGLWFFISQVVHDIESVDVGLFLPFLFAGWVGNQAYKVTSVLSDRIVSLENHIEQLREGVPKLEEPRVEPTSKKQ